MRNVFVAPSESAARFKSERATSLARRLRKTMTPAETALWYALRRERAAGTHFRRQAPIGAYVVDFACLKAKLAIELDGGAHKAPDTARGDADRDAWLEARGLWCCALRMLRCWRMSRALRGAWFPSPRRACRTVRNSFGTNSKNCACTPPLPLAARGRGALCLRGAHLRHEGRRRCSEGRFWLWRGSAVKLGFAVTPRP